MMLFFLLCLFMGDFFFSACFQHSGAYVTHNVGEELTLLCSITDETVMLYWFKQTLGQKPNLISTLYKYDQKGLFYNEFKDKSRFYLSPDNHLTIYNLQVSDTATYYCACSQTYVLLFAEGTNVIVKGSDLNIETEVHQSSLEDIQPGRSVTLNCTVHTGTCDGEHSVYWFKKSEESEAGVLYAPGGSNSQCERNEDGQTNYCVYNLPLLNVTADDTGTYYCAVASCGHLLFGNGTKLDFEGFSPSSHVSVLSGALAFTSILVVIMAFTICVLNKRNHTEPYMKVSTSSKKMAKSFQKGDILYYVATEQMKRSTSRKHRDDTWSECVYFNVQ